MATIINSTPWTSQPQQAVGIDWGNPINRGLVYCKNLALETGFTKVGTKIVASEGWSALGFGATFGLGSTDSVETTLTTSSTARTILVLYVKNGTGGGTAGRIFDKRTVSGQVEEMQTGGSGMLYGGSWTGGTGLFTWAGQPTSTPVSCVVSYDKSSTSNVPIVIENGVRQSVTTSSAPSGSVITNTDPYVIGNRKNDNARNWDGTIALFAVFDRALSEQEAKSLSANPWQIFKPLPRRIFVPVSAAGGLYTLTAQSGSYTVIGQQATLLRHRNLTASAGTYNITGQSVNITYSPTAAVYTLTAQSGSYALTGRSATLLKSKLLSTSSGSYSITGNSATISKNRVLTATSGSYTITGRSATLTYVPLTPVYTLTAQTGVYNITGQTAQLLRHRLLTTSAGSYVYTGQSITINKYTSGTSNLVKYVNVLTGEVLILKQLGV